MLPDERMRKALMRLPDIIKKSLTSHVQQNRPIKWDAYKVYMDNDDIFIKRNLCNRCQEVMLPDEHLIDKVVTDKELGKVHILSGICRPCIQVRYYDQYLDGEAITRKEANKLWKKYLEEYEDAWELVLRNAAVVALPEKEWLDICKHFNGCAVCGGPIQLRALFFPATKGGSYTAWNVIPLCEACQIRGRFNRHRDRKNKQFDPRKKLIRGCMIFKNIQLFYKTKTVRMFLLHQMRKHNINIAPLEPYIRRFFDDKKTEY